MEVRVDEDGGGEEEGDERHREDRSQGPSHCHLRIKYQHHVCTTIVIEHRCLLLAVCLTVARQQSMSL